MNNSFNPIDEKTMELLEHAVNGRLWSGASVSEEFFHDEMPIYGLYAPEAIAFPHSTEEVSSLLKICHERRIPVTPRGGGTGLAGGAVPIYGGLVLSMREMNEILEFDMDRMTVRVQPGVLLGELQEACGQRGLMYPPDPAEKLATLGGNISTNAGGVRAVKYGTTRDYVRAMTAVLPTGETLRLGADVAKNSTGYSLLHLIIGSEGTLGVITELTLKLVALPREDILLVVPFSTLDDCISTVPRILKAGFIPKSLEFMEADIVRAAEAGVGQSLFPSSVEGEAPAAYLLMGFDGDSIEELERATNQVGALLLEEGAMDILVADSQNAKKNLLATRESFLDVIKYEAALIDEMDVVVPITEIARFLSYVRERGEVEGLAIRAFGHAGDGNIHIYVCGGDMDKTEFSVKADSIMNAAYKRAAELGGTLSGEHGVGFAKTGYLPLFMEAASLRLMREVKGVFDPHMILNPGKIFDISEGSEKA